MGSKYVVAPARSTTSVLPSLSLLQGWSTFITTPTNIIVTCRTFLAESRLILARIIWSFELSLVNKDDKDWPDNRAYLAYEPKALMVTLREKRV